MQEQIRRQTRQPSLIPSHTETSEGIDEKEANIYTVLGSMLASSISDLDNQWDLVYYCMGNSVNGPGKQTVNMEQTTKYTEWRHQQKEPVTEKLSQRDKRRNKGAKFTFSQLKFNQVNMWRITSGRIDVCHPLATPNNRTRNTNTGRTCVWEMT